VKLSEFWRYTILKSLFKDDESEEKTYFVLTLFTGLLGGVVAVLIHSITKKLIDFFGTGQAFEMKSWIFGGLCILISGFITTRFFPSTAGSGIPGVRIALAVFHGKISFLATLMKFFVSILSLSSGMSLGREGPTVSITAGIGSSLGEFFSLSKKRIKALVAVGTAGGLAASFHTPISAVVFTLEEVVGDLNAKMLGSIIISSVIASITAQFLTGHNSTFTELSYTLNDPIELVIYLALGVCASLAGVFWVKTVLKFRGMNKNVFKGHKLSSMLFAFTIMGLFSYIHPAVLGGGHDTIENALLSLILDWKTLAIVFVLKFSATALCFSTGVSGGIFLPTLLIGAMLGSLVGTVGGHIFPESTSSLGAYALVGMGAYFVAVIRAPFTSILMVFELTRNYNIILPLMIANAVSYFISNRLHVGSIYESISEQDGIHLPKKEDHEVLHSIVVEDAMVTNVTCLNADQEIEKAYEISKEHDYSGFPVIKNNKLVGMISTNELRSQYAKGDGAKKVKEVCETQIVSVYPDESLLLAFHKLNKYQVSRLPVVSRLNHQRLVGLVTAENIVSNFGYHIKEEEDEQKIEDEDIDLSSEEEKLKPSNESKD
jgi:CIC family chloride channel protein